MMRIKIFLGGIIGLFIISSFFACKQGSSADVSTSTFDSAITFPDLVITSFQEIDSSKLLIKTGDLIVRTGRDFTSTLLRNLSLTDKTYSHCGIAQWQGDSLYVYHIIGGDGNPDGKVRKDSFSFFCNPYENSGFGIFRYQLSTHDMDAMMKEIENFYQSDIRFDMSFDLDTDNEMYCSELVYKVLLHSGHDFIPLIQMNGKKYVAIDNLYLNSHCQEIKRVAFPQR